MMRPSITYLLPLLLSACSVASSLEGPGWDSSDGVVTDAEGPFLVVATHTKIASGERKAFGDHVDAITTQLDLQPGFLGQSLRAHLPGRERWTLTIWEDEASVLEFALSGAHLAAMGDGATVIDGVYTASWWVEADELPVKWSTAVEELAAVAPDEPW